MKPWIYTSIVALGAAAASALIAFGFSPGSETLAEEAMTRAQVEQIVREYLLEHPELLIEVMNKLDEKQIAERAAEAKKIIAENRKALDDDGYSFVAGNPKGDVTVIEFFDYNCVYCRHTRPNVLALIEADPNVRVVLKEFPILGPASETAARAAMASVAQGKYWDYHNKMLGAEEKMDEARIYALAQEAGLDVERLKRDMAAPAIEEHIKEIYGLAEKLRIDGTPTFIIGDTLVSSAQTLDELKEHVAAARAKCETC